MSLCMVEVPICNVVFSLRQINKHFTLFFSTFLYENEATGLEQAVVVTMATRVLRPLKRAFLKSILPQLISVQMCFHLPSSLSEVSQVVPLVLLQQWKQREVNYLREEVNSNMVLLLYYNYFLSKCAFKGIQNYIQQLVSPLI